MIKFTSAIRYYLFSIPVILTKTNFWDFPFLLFMSPIKVTVNKKLQLYVWSFMEVWTIVEVVINKCYEQFRSPQENDTIIDIGASIGDFSIAKSKENQGKVKILAFEASAKLVSRAKKNIGLNHAINISIRKEKITSLNDIFKKYKIIKCDFLKVDCEGNEYEIFKKTYDQTLSKIKYIAMECHTFNPTMTKKYSKLKKRLTKRFFIKEIENPVHTYLTFLFASQKS